MRKTNSALSTMPTVATETPVTPSTPMALPAPAVKTPKAKTKKYDGTIARTKVKGFLLDNAKNKIFSITAPTKTKPTRVFAGRLTAPKSQTPKTKGADVSSIGYLRMYDMVNHGWRNVNLQTATELKFGGKCLKIK